MNNAVQNSRGDVVGFRCHVCDQVKSKMWGEVCNECRSRQEQHSELASTFLTYSRRKDAEHERLIGKLYELLPANPDAAYDLVRAEYLAIHGRSD